MSEFSAEQQSALDVVLSILQSPEYAASRRAVLAKQDPTRSANAPSRTASNQTASNETAGNDSAVATVRISRRDEIPLMEKHVLVMWGLSTYQNTHALGTTFVIDNSMKNVSRDEQFKTALAEATQLATERGLRRIYVMD